MLEAKLITTLTSCKLFHLVNINLGRPSTPSKQAAYVYWEEALYRHSDHGLCRQFLSTESLLS